MTEESLTSLGSRFRKRYAPSFFPVILGFISGFSVFYFLYLFGAYGIQKGLSYSGHSHLFRSISFGILTFAYLTAFEGWLKPKLNITRLGPAILWYLGLVFLGSQLIFLLFNFFWNWQEWNLESYGLILIEFPLLMVLPLSFYLVLKKILTSQNSNVSYITFQSKNGKDQLRINPKYFLYANSLENYITISYTSDGQSKQHLIRKPLKALEQELKAYPEIKRTHRSYLVNSSNIQAVKQIKGKVLLEVNGTSIPVSKQYQHTFLND